MDTDLNYLFVVGYDCTIKLLTSKLTENYLLEFVENEKIKDFTTREQFSCSMKYTLQSSAEQLLEETQDSYATKYRKFLDALEHDWKTCLENSKNYLTVLCTENKQYYENLVSSKGKYFQAILAKQLNTKNIEQIQREKLSNRRSFYDLMLTRESENFGSHEGQYANIIADFQKHLKHI